MQSGRLFVGRWATFIRSDMTNLPFGGLLEPFVGLYDYGRQKAAVNACECRNSTRGTATSNRLDLQYRPIHTNNPYVRARRHILAYNLPDAVADAHLAEALLDGFDQR